MADVHQTIGGLVVVAFIVTAILAAIAAAGNDDRWVRMASYIAAGLLALQYILGVLLLGNGSRNSNEHYIIGLLILVPLALQHSSAKRLSPQTRGVATMIWSLAAAFLGVIAYLSGTWGVASAGR
jgi:heme A synthase